MLFAVGFVVFAGGCAGGDSPPEALMDGSRPSPPPVVLEGVDGDQLLTKVALVDANRIARGGRTSECLRGRASGARPLGTIVERVSVAGESVTLRDASGLFACDNTSGPREEDRRWCGGSFGDLDGGRLLDPRLDIGGCSTRDGGPVAFLWVVPSRDAKYVALRQADYVEVYPVAGGLPVRIATLSGFLDEPLGVAVEISEHDEDGRMLAERTLEAFPAG